MFKKLIPTLLPLLGLAVTAISPDMQGIIGHFVGAHPAWSTVITTGSLIFNHWIPAPNQLPSNSSVARAGTSLMLCFALVLVPMGMTGCTYSQAEVVQAVQRVETTLKTAKSLLPAANLIAADLRITDPEAAEYMQPLVDAAGPALDKLISISDAYIANPGSDAYQAILNGVDAFVTQVDQQTLATVKIKNPQSQQKAVTWIALFDTGLHVGLGLLEHYASSKQVKALPVQTARVSMDQLRPFLNRAYAKQELTELGYNPDVAFAAAGF